MYYSADIGVIGGSGLYELTNDTKKIDLDTPYGKPSDTISLVKYGDKTIAFLPRHGKGHTLSPANINYLANIDAMAQLGIKGLISPCCVGSLNPVMAPGHFVVTDQFINMTAGRKDTFYSGSDVQHPSSADPYDEKLRGIAIEEAKSLGITVHEKGTVVIINGPRFSTRAESRMFRMLGGDLVNMTQYPEGYLALERSIPVVNVALVTDYDAGLEGDPDVKPVTDAEVQRVLKANTEKVKKLIFRIIDRIEV